MKQLLTVTFLFIAFNLQAQKRAVLLVDLDTLSRPYIEIFFSGNKKVDCIIDYGGDGDFYFRLGNKQGEQIFFINEIDGINYFAKHGYWVKSRYSSAIATMYLMENREKD